MIVPGAPRVKELANGNTYWMSSATLGLIQVQLKWHDQEFALVFTKDDYHQVRFADTTFYEHKPR